MSRVKSWSLHQVLQSAMFMMLNSQCIYSRVCAQLLGSPLTQSPPTRTSSSPTTTWRWRAAATTTGWSWVTLPSPAGFITGKWLLIAMTTTRTQPLGSLGVTSWRMWCWGRMTRPGPCTWTTTVPGSCTTTRTPTGEESKWCPWWGGLTQTRNS